MTEIEKNGVINHKTVVIGSILIAAATVFLLIAEVVNLLPGNMTIPAFLVLMAAASAFPFAKMQPQDFRFLLLSFVSGFVFFLLINRFDRLGGPFMFGHALGFKPADTPISSGLLWFVPVILSIPFSQFRPDNIYLRSLIGSVFTFVPAIFILISGPLNDMFYWGNPFPPLSVYILTFCFSYLLHFTAIQLGYEQKNPFSKILYICWIGFWIVDYFAHLVMVKN